MTTVIQHQVLFGLDAVRVELSITAGEGNGESFEIRGLPAAAAAETRVRVVSSLAKLRVYFHGEARLPEGAPAGPYDLAIAVGVLAELGRVPAPAPGVLFLGELALDATLRPLRGALALLSAAEHEEAVVPWGSRYEAATAGAKGVGSPSLGQVIEHLNGKRRLERLPTLSRTVQEFEEVPERFRAIAAELAEDRRSLLLLGPPSSGKTVLARAIAARSSIDPDDGRANQRIVSAAGLLNADEPLPYYTTPFRAPHHSLSELGLLGGGTVPRPGEVSLAHGGVLFLDDLPEFRASALDSLKGALRRGEVTGQTGGRRWRFPARPRVIASASPCPCGYHGSARACRCAPALIERYRARFTGFAEHTVNIACL